MRAPPGCWKRTGFQQGRAFLFASSPLAASTGADQPFSSRRDTQMPTSSAPSRFPPNHAAISLPFDSQIVDAWQEGNGAVSKMNSDGTTGEAARAGPEVRDKSTIVPKIRRP